MISFNESFKDVCNVDERGILITSIKDPWHTIETEENSCAFQAIFHGDSIVTVRLFIATLSCRENQRNGYTNPKDEKYVFVYIST